MDLTMSMFASPTAYWEARALLAEQALCETATALGCEPDNEAMLVAADRGHWIKAAKAALELLGDFPVSSNAGYARGLLREALSTCPEIRAT